MNLAGELLDILKRIKNYSYYRRKTMINPPNGNASVETLVYGEPVLDEHGRVLPNSASPRIVFDPNGLFIPGGFPVEVVRKGEKP
jgi:hypothetical protein